MKLLGKSGRVLGAENVSNYLPTLGVSHSATARTRHFPPDFEMCVDYRDSFSGFDVLTQIVNILYLFFTAL